MHGAIHPYYSLSIAPPVAAMFALGVHELWAVPRKVVVPSALAVCWAVPVCGAGGFWAATATGCPACGGPSWRWQSRRQSRYWDRGRRGPAAGWRSARLALDGWRAGRSRGIRDRHDRPAASGRWTVRRPAGGDGHNHFGFGQMSDNPDLDAMLKDTDTEWSAAIRPLIERRRTRIVHRHCGHGDRRVLGHRSGADAEPVPGRRRPAQGRLLHRGEHPRPRAGLGQPRSCRHREVGRGQLPVVGGRGRHGVRPVGAEVD